MKILNLYAGIGGNRKLWGDDHEITAVEYDSKIASIYQDFFPNDKVIVVDAHQYLLDHFQEYDFIWSSPPCPSHSQFAKLRGLSNDVRSGNSKTKPKYPDMKLYEEIIFLQHYYKGDYVIENVVPYYKPLVEAQKIQRHLFWSNKKLQDKRFSADNIKRGKVKEWQEQLGFDLSNYSNVDKRMVLRNCVKPELGLHIFKSFTSEGEATRSV